MIEGAENQWEKESLFSFQITISKYFHEIYLKMLEES